MYFKSYKSCNKKGDSLGSTPKKVLTLLTEFTSLDRKNTELLQYDFISFHGAPLNVKYKFHAS